MLVDVQKGGRFNTVGDRQTGRNKERERKRRRGRAYVSRRQRRGALMGADAGSDWVSARLTRAHPLPVVESSVPPARRDKESVRKPEEAMALPFPSLVLQHIFLA